MPTLVSDYAKELRQVGDESFSRRHPHPMLVVTGLDGSLANQAALNRTAMIAPRDPAAQAIAGLIGRVFPVVKAEDSPAGPVSIGRTPDNDVRIAESSISARHCLLHLSPSEIWLSDAGSTNGTLVNGAPVEPKKSHKLNDGDTITLGRFNLQFYTPDGFIKDLQARSG